MVLKETQDGTRGWGTGAASIGDALFVKLHGKAIFGSGLLSVK